MKICPIAIAVGCGRCPAVKICPLKGSIGDFRPSADAQARAAPVQAEPKRSAAAGKKTVHKKSSGTRKRPGR